jgi:hypothetical protein
LAALLERNEKQALLAKQSQRLIALLDDSPIVPGEEPRPFQGVEQGRSILNDAEAELREWTPSWDPHVTDLAHHQPNSTYHDAHIEHSHGSHTIGASEKYAESNAATVGAHGGAVGTEQRMLEEERA